MIWNCKKKAITFSFDDGVLQDIRAIAILDKYGLKATFNLNSGKFGT
jgi:peptidoglycan/xylan/chitin deacetylase (PgdA/CDA1 family)